MRLKAGFSASHHRRHGSAPKTPAGYLPVRVQRGELQEIDVFPRHRSTTGQQADATPKAKPPSGYSTKNRAGQLVSEIVWHFHLGEKSQITQEQWSGDHCAGDAGWQIGT